MQRLRARRRPRQHLSWLQSDTTRRGRNAHCAMRMYLSASSSCLSAMLGSALSSNVERRMESGMGLKKVQWHCLLHSQIQVLSSPPVLRSLREVRGQSPNCHAQPRGRRFGAGLCYCWCCEENDVTPTEQASTK